MERDVVGDRHVVEHRARGSGRRPAPPGSWASAGRAPCAVSAPTASTAAVRAVPSRMSIASTSGPHLAGGGSRLSAEQGGRRWRRIVVEPTMARRSAATRTARRRRRPGGPAPLERRGWSGPLDALPPVPALGGEAALAVEQARAASRSRATATSSPSQPRVHVAARLDAPPQLGGENGDLGGVDLADPRRDVAVAPVLAHPVGGPPQPPGRVVGPGDGQPGQPGEQSRPTGRCRRSGPGRAAASPKAPAWSPAMRSIWRCGRRRAGPATARPAASSPSHQ